jgi:hypothetical protein
MEPDEGPADCSDKSRGYDSLADHPCGIQKQRISPSFEMAEKSDVLLQSKGHAMKDRIAPVVIVILAFNFLPAIWRVHLRIRPVLPRSTPLKAAAEPRAVKN